MLRIVDARIISRDLIVLSDGLPRRGPASSLVNAGASNLTDLPRSSLSWAVPTSFL